MKRRPQLCLRCRESLDTHDRLALENCAAIIEKDYGVPMIVGRPLPTRVRHGNIHRPGRWVMEGDKGVGIVELALTLPVIVLLLLGGLGVGLALLSDMRLEHVAGEAATAVADGTLVQADVEAMVAAEGGTLACYWVGIGPGGCYDDGLAVQRVQVIATNSVPVPMFGSIDVAGRAVGISP